MRWRVALGALGVGLMAFAVIGGLLDREARRPGVVVVLVAVVLGHDLLLLPVALLVGAAVRRWLPGPVRTPVRGGLFVSAVVAAVAVPLMAGPGTGAFGRGSVVILTLVWAGVAGWLFGRWAVAAGRRRGAGPSGRLPEG